jgi:hypothetical protein
VIGTGCSHRGGGRDKVEMSGPIFFLLFNIFSKYNN